MKTKRFSTGLHKGSGVRPSGAQGRGEGAADVWRSSSGWRRAPLLCGMLLLSCDVDLGGRNAPASRTFGEIVYTESCNRVAYSGELAEVQAGKRKGLDASGVGYRGMCRFGGEVPAGAPPVMNAVQTARKSIIDDVNVTAPESLLEPLNLTLRASLSAFDGPEARQAALGSGTVLLGLSADPAAVGALGRLSYRVGYRPPGTEGAAARGLLDVKDLYTSLNQMLPLLYPDATAALDASAVPRRQLYPALFREMAATTAVPDVHASDRTLRLGLNFLLSEYAELRTLPAGQNIYGVLRDARGLPDINKSGPGGTLPALYRDSDRDGRADVDASGHFLSTTGSPLPDVSPFPLLDKSKRDNAAARDADGRALLTGTTPLYRYQNLDDTILAALLRETPGLLDPSKDIPLRLASGLRQLLGNRVPATRDYGAENGGALAYTGFDTSSSKDAPLVDLIHAFVQILGFSNTGTDASHLLRTVYLLLRDQESPLARNLSAVAKAFDEAKKPAYDSATVAEDSTLYDDLAPILVRLMRQPALMADVVAAMSDPAVADLGPLTATLMNDADYFTMSQSVLDSTLPGAVSGSLGKAVNRSLPDSDVDQNSSNSANNRSIMQRVLHLVHDANNAKFCNKDGAKITSPIPLPGTYVPCELMQIDDLALFYLISIADSSVKDNIPEADFINAIKNDLLRNGLTCALFGSLIGLPGFSCTARPTSSFPFFKLVVYPKPEAAARLLFQDNALRSAFQKDAMDFGSCEPRRQGTLCCNQNHSWQAHHNGALFALEAVKAPSGRTFYDALRPLVNAFGKYNECIQRSSSGTCTKTQNAAKILIDLLSVLHRHWPTLQSRFHGFDYEAQSKKDGLSRYEPLIANLLGSGDLLPSSLALSPALLNTRTDDGTNQQAINVITKLGQWLFDPEVARLGGSLSYRDGRTAAVRNDGQPTFKPTGDTVILDVLTGAGQGKVTPYDLLAEAFRNKRARLHAAPTVEAGWKGAMSNLGDLYLQSRSVGAGSYKFQNPRIRSLQLAGVDLLRQRVLAHSAKGDLQSWVQKDFLRDTTDMLTGPIGAASLDLVESMNTASPPARQALFQILSAYTADPGPGAADAPRFRGLLSLSADLLQLMLDDADLVPIVRKLAPLFDPQNGAIEGAGWVTLRSLPSDPNQVLLQLGKNLLRADINGLYPAYRLGEILNEIHRARAGETGVYGSDLNEADMQAITQGLGLFLADPMRGAVRLVDIVQNRHLPQ
ncbi:MAG TPA: hypothetical protein PKI03_30635 [Pseudomonadota bacterium]|nr:hypothetical protein [Pseudomonadota bacterium]